MKRGRAAYSDPVCDIDLPEGNAVLGLKMSVLSLKGPEGGAVWRVKQSGKDCRKINNWLSF